VKDINPGPQNSLDYEMVNLNGEVYFFAEDAVNGDGLWKSDGTEAGTQLVKALNKPSQLTLVNHTLFFSASDEINGEVLWKSDGTEAGTLLVYPIKPSRLEAVDGILFFSADDGVHGNELWISDGTEAGTNMVKDIYPGSEESRPMSLTDVNGTLFFHATDPVNGPQLWKSDGTEAGTVLVKAVSALPYSPAISHLTNVNGTLFFRVQQSSQDYELWKSDGTAEGTILLKAFDQVGFGISPSGLMAYNDILFFLAADSTYGREIWKSDGTPEGTVIANDFTPGSESSTFEGLTVFKNALYFIANANELWKTDGTEVGTIFVDTIPTANISRLVKFSAHDDFLYFVDRADRLYPGNYIEIYTINHWVCTGMENGCEMFHSHKSLIAPSTEQIDFSSIAIGNQLLYSANDYTHGHELWTYDLADPTPPTVTILSPSDGDTFYTGDLISFVGVAKDPDGDLTADLVWSSDIDGEIGVGGSFDAALSEGVHLITASVVDSDGLTGTAQVTVNVVTNTTPEVEILAPADRSTFDFEVPIWLNGNAADAEDGDISDLISWSSSLDGAIGTGESVVFYNASPGAHVITAEITDSAGGNAQTTIRILVFGNTPPVPILFSPEFPDGVVGTWYKFVALYGDKNGSSDFLTLQVHMDAGLGNPNGLNVLYLVDANELYLQETDGENWIGPCTPGEVGTLSNGIVEINCKLTTPYYLGDHFMKLRILARWNQAVEAPVELDALLRATDIFDNDSGFKSKGTWTLLPEESSQLSQRDSKPGRFEIQQSFQVFVNFILLTQPRSLP
jgi:ELWxxDGT repeat protein